MQHVRDIIEIYFAWAAIFGVAMAASRITRIRSIGVVRFAIVVTMCSLAWPKFIVGKYFL